MMRLCGEVLVCLYDDLWIALTEPCTELSAHQSKNRILTTLNDFPISLALPIK